MLREVFNSGWQHNWGFVPFTEHEFATMGDQLKFLVPDDMIHIAEVDGAPAPLLSACQTSTKRLPICRGGYCRSVGRSSCGG